MAIQLPIVTENPDEAVYYRPGRWWHSENDRIVCDLCPRECVLKDGDRGFCFVRQNVGHQMMLTTFGRSTGFCIDPIEKKPLNHFYPGTSVLSFGTAGCNLGCKFCQNWDISKSREIERLSNRAFPEDIARAAHQLGCHSVAYTYNDPIVWAEYAIETAKACRAVGVKNVAVTAGYITHQAREEFFAPMDAANVDLKAFSEEFYHKITLSHIEPILDTLRYLKRETDVWFEITNLIIPRANDDPGELKQMCEWILESVGDDVPVHFSAFHPDYKMMDRENTPPETLIMAREIALRAGIKYAYTGNVHNAECHSTYCPSCRKVVIERDWYELGYYALNGNKCGHCGHTISGHFHDRPGNWGRKRMRVDMSQFATPAAPMHSRANEQQGSAVVPPRSSFRPGPDSSVPPAGTRNTAPKNGNTPMVTSPLVQPPTLTEAQQLTLLNTAAEYILSAANGWAPEVPDPEIAGIGSNIVNGIYVSLKRAGHLRSCCGFFGRNAQIKQGLQDAAFRTATSDPRFPPISPVELPYLDLEVWLLFAPSPVEEQGEDRVGAIEIGRHGLFVSNGENSGLLLPGVPVEAGWDSLEFLNRVCIKAGLAPTTWRESAAKLMKFEGQSYRGRVITLEQSEGYTTVREFYGPAEMDAYRQYAQNTMSAILQGATPMYYFSGARDCHVNGLIVKAHFHEAGRSISGWRWSTRNPGPLQSAMFGVCEELAISARRSGLSGAFTIDFAFFYSPATHGTIASPDLGGLDPTKRSMLVAERSRSAWVYDPTLSPAELLNKAARLAEIIDPEFAQVLSFSTQSTQAPIDARSIPQPQSGAQDRRPGVAGKFYPDDPGRVSVMLEQMLSGAPANRRQCSAIMVPHAGWRFSGRIAADILKETELPRTIIAIGPKHTALGVDWAVAPHRTWLLPVRNVPSDPELARKLADAIPGLQLDAAAHQNEHGVEVELPIIARLSPETRVVGIALGGGTLRRCEEFAEGLARVISEMPEKPLLLISSDMNHFASDAETRRLDEMALQQLDKLDEDALFRTCRDNHISMCGMLPAVIVLKTLKKLGRLTKSERGGYATSYDTTGNPERVVGYAGMWFE